MRILRSRDYRRMPWKNGGGETVEIAVFPEGAGLGEFEWRVSMATVASDGPFSIFPDIDRTLSILDGDGMQLLVEGREAVVLTQGSEPLPFPADAVASATLLAGPIVDLNVMTRRGARSHSVSRLVVDGNAGLDTGGQMLLLFCSRGRLDVEVGGHAAALEERDCLVLGARQSGALQLSGKSVCYVIRIADL
jgi:uncharacterized protein